MDGFQGMGRLIVVFGLLMVGLGVLMMLIGRVPGLGRLPGDIVWRRENVTFYFAPATSILLSILLTVILNLFIRR